MITSTPSFGSIKPKVHVQAVCKCNRRTRLDVVVDVFFVCFSLKFVGHCEHDHVTPSGSFGNAHNLEAFAFGFGLAEASLRAEQQQGSWRRCRAGSARGRGPVSRSRGWQLS